MSSLNNINPKSLLVFLALLISSQQGWGAMEIVKHAVTGYGDTREVAIVIALIEAVSQITSVSVEGKQLLQTKFQEVVIDSDTISKESFSSSSNLQQQLLREATGYVKSYEVVSLEESTDGFGWEAVLRVQIPKYVGVGQDRSKMRSMAVMPFRMLADIYTIGQKTVSAGEVSGLINHSLISGHNGT